MKISKKTIELFKQVINEMTSLDGYVTVSEFNLAMESIMGDHVVSTTYDNIDELGWHGYFNREENFFVGKWNTSFLFCEINLVKENGYLMSEWDSSSGRRLIFSPSGYKELEGGIAIENMRYLRSILIPYLEKEFEKQFIKQRLLVESERL